MTSEVSQALEKAETLSEIDDIYRPFRPKRKRVHQWQKQRIAAAGRLHLGTKSTNQSGTGGSGLS